MHGRTSLLRNTPSNTRRRTPRANYVLAKGWKTNRISNVVPSLLSRWYKLQQAILLQVLRFLGRARWIICHAILERCILKSGELACLLSHIIQCHARQMIILQTGTSYRTSLPLQVHMYFEHPSVRILFSQSFTIQAFVQSSLHAMLPTHAFAYNNKILEFGDMGNMSHVAYPTILLAYPGGNSHFCTGVGRRLSHAFLLSLRSGQKTRLL